MVAVGLWYGAGISYRQQTQLHFIKGNLNAQRYRDEILRPIVNSMFQFPPISSNFTQPLKRSGTTFHSRPQSAASSTLCEGDVTCCMRQMVVTPDTDRFYDPCPNLFFYLNPQSCEIHRLGPNKCI
jgi:hypothetical protein